MRIEGRSQQKYEMCFDLVVIFWFIGSSFKR